MPSPDPSPESAGSPWTLSRPRHNRAWWIGGGVSVLLHALALLFYGGVAGPPTVSVAPAGGEATDIRGLELLNLLARAEDDPEPEPPEEPEEEQPERIALPVDPRPAEESGAAEMEGPGEVAEEDEVPTGPGAAERLRVSLNPDPRLYAPLANEALGQLTTEQILAVDLAFRLGFLNDSIAAEAQRAAGATDWTYTDDEGNRWGISPGKIHLGSVTLPLPFSFAGNTGTYEERQDREYIDAELARGAAAAAVWATIRERAEAIRERRDREREEARTRDITGRGPRRAVPDTTGGRR